MTDLTTARLEPDLGKVRPLRRLPGASRFRFHPLAGPAMARA
jgi:hypothetical protein